MKLKKSLGQNFFINSHLADKIVNCVEAEKYRNIIEIGPGEGFFTKRLININKNLILIEKDENLSKLLEGKFQTVKVFNMDFLDFNLNNYQFETPLLFFGSLPYNVSKKIISQCIQSNLFSRAYFIIQKEVADKYCEREKSSFLSVSTKIYADCKKLFDIERGSFRPIPKVTSSFILFKKNRNKDTVSNIALFKQLVKNAYCSPRKKLRSNLDNFSRLNIPNSILDKRAENLSFIDYLTLSNSLNDIIIQSEEKNIAE